MTVLAPVLTVTEPMPSTHARMPRGRTALTLSVPLSNVTDALPGPPHPSFRHERASRTEWCRDTTSGMTVIFPEATTLALPLPRLSACMAPASFPLEVSTVPCKKFTLALWGAPPFEYDRVSGEVARGAAHINCGVRCRNLASPLDCIRSPVWLLPVGLLLLRMVTLSAVIVMGALVAVVPVVLAALTALMPGEPAGMVT